MPHYTSEATLSPESLMPEVCASSVWNQTLWSHSTEFKWDPPHLTSPNLIYKKPEFQSLIFLLPLRFVANVKNVENPVSVWALLWLLVLWCGRRPSGQHEWNQQAWTQYLPEYKDQHCDFVDVPGWLQSVVKALFKVSWSFKYIRGFNGVWWSVQSKQESVHQSMADVTL